MRQSSLPIISVLAAVLAVGCGSETTDTGASDSAKDSSMVTVYTGRHYGIEPVFDAFTKATGIEVRFTTGKDPELRERLGAEGKNTPADVLMAADAGNLAMAADADLLAATSSSKIDAAVPANLRDAESRWTALSRRARVIMVSDRVDEADQPTTYAGLGDPKWRKKLCLRPATHPYTQSLVSSMILADGAEQAEVTAAAWVANEPFFIDSDTEILEALIAGECDVAVTNSYYLARMTKEQGEVPVRLVWPEQGDGERGAHINISGAGVTTHAPNPEGAKRFIEWLATDGQAQFAEVNLEFPADPSVEPDPLLTAWGEFRADPVDVSEFGRIQPEAVKLLDRVGYR